MEQSREVVYSFMVCVIFYFSWGIGRAFFPEAGNEMCQVAKVETSIAPIKAALPIGARYYKSTKLIIRNTEQLDILETNLPKDAFNSFEQTIPSNKGLDPAQNESSVG